MNLRGIVKKLQLAILQTGLVIKVNTHQFYSPEQKRMINKYEISTPVYRPTTSGEWKDMEYNVLSTYSTVEVIQCMNDIYKAVRA